METTTQFVPMKHAAESLGMSAAALRMSFRRGSLPGALLARLSPRRIVVDFTGLMAELDRRRLGARDGSEAP